MELTQFKSEIARAKTLTDFELATELHMTHEGISILLSFNPAYESEIDWNPISILEAECAARFVKKLLKKELTKDGEPTIHPT